MVERTSITAPLVSVVVPAYNCAGSIEATVESLRRQTLRQDLVETIIINDGSSDGTLDACRQIAARPDSVTLIDKPNGGVGSARNAGIEAARGRYIAFLDADDELQPETLEYAARFFDKHYDEIDLVTYPMILYNEQREWHHTRERILTETGVYDLTKLQNAFALITNVNVLVKNNASLPRFREDLQVHEDEQFFMNVLLRKQKVGFSNVGAYRYRQHANSAIATKMHPYYQFEATIGFWEELFARYPGKAPLYLQASFLNEINWKIRQDVLFPYHYEKHDFDRAVSRIRALLGRVDNDVILTSPRSDEFYQHYLMSLKRTSELSCFPEPSGFVIRDRDEFLICRSAASLEIAKTWICNGELLIEGIVRSLLFEYASDCQLILESDAGRTQTIELLSTSLDYHEGRTKTNSFRKFAAGIPADIDRTISFFLESKTTRLVARISYDKRANLSPKEGICAFMQNGVVVEGHGDRIRIAKRLFHLGKASLWIRNTALSAKADSKAPKRRFAALAKRVRQQVWLYYDDPSVEQGNAYAQFLHDKGMADGIKRYYVTRAHQRRSDARMRGDASGDILPFESAEHRYLHVNADLIIASHPDHGSWCPFSWSSMRALADMVRYRVAYLPQHVLLGHEPWRLSEDRILADCVFASTSYEVDVLQTVYGYRRDQIFPCGMPQLDQVEIDAPSRRKILYAPSWRSHLVARCANGSYTAKLGSFDRSQFWRGATEFLGASSLQELLDRNDLVLDIKLDPRFSAFRDMFDQLACGRIKIADETHAEDYLALVTDFSPRAFDFAYLKRPVVYFLPDREEFAAGLHEFRQLDLSWQDGFGPLCVSSQDTLAELERLIRRGFSADARYAQRMDGFFLHYDHQNRERIYRALKSL